MEFNMNKFGVMGMGKRNLVSVPDKWWLGQTNKWMDFGVLIAKNLKI